MRYCVRARNGASTLQLARETQDSAELAAIVLKEKGYTDVAIEKIERDLVVTGPRLASPSA